MKTEIGIVTKCYKEDNTYTIEYKYNPILFWKRRKGYGFNRPFRIDSKIKVLLDGTKSDIVLGAKEMELYGG